MEKLILEQSQKYGMPLPDSIRDAPELDLGLELYYLGFLDLTSCRSFGMALGPIPHIAILRYCDETDLIGEQREDFVWMIKRLDDLYLAYSGKTKDK